jgi:hypothetical protein
MYRLGLIHSIKGNNSCFTRLILYTCVTNDHGYVPLVVNTSRSFPHSWLITGFVTRLTRRVPLVEQELLTLPDHLSSPPVFSGVCVTRSLVLYVCFVDRCLSFSTFSFGHCEVMNEERTGKCLRQVEHNRGHLWHRYSIAVNQVMVVTVTFSKWWLQLYQKEPWVGLIHRVKRRGE